MTQQGPAGQPTRRADDRTLLAAAISFESLRSDPSLRLRSAEELPE
jgi:hypothetical protein